MPLFLFGGILFALPVIFSDSASASSTMYISAPSQNVQLGNNLIVNINGYVDYYPLVPAIDSGSKRVYGIITYPPNRLQLMSVSTSNSAYNWRTSMSIDNTGGRLTFDNQSLGTYGQTINIMTMTFQTWSVGSATIGFAPGTRYDVNVPILYPGSFNITAPPSPSPTPTPTPTPTPSPTPKPTPSPTPTPSPSPVTTPGSSGTPTSVSPVISAPTTSAFDSSKKTDESTAEKKKELTISNGLVTRGYDRTTISWRTDKPSKNAFAYGVSASNLDKTLEVMPSADDGYEVQLSGLTPGQQYYFKIAATANEDSAKTDTYTGKFTTKGYPVAVTITENGKPAANLKVTLGTQKHETDKFGVLNLEFPSGTHSLDIETVNGKKTVSVVVVAKILPSDGTAPEPQKFTFDVPGANNGEEIDLGWLSIVGVVVGILTIVGAFIFTVVAIRRKRDRPVYGDTDAIYTPQQPLPSYYGNQTSYSNNVDQPAYQEPENSANLAPYSDYSDTYSETGLSFPEKENPVARVHDLVSKNEVNQLEKQYAPVPEQHEPIISAESESLEPVADKQPDEPEFEPEVPDNTTDADESEPEMDQNIEQNEIVEETENTTESEEEPETIQEDDPTELTIEDHEPRVREEPESEPTEELPPEPKPDDGGEEIFIKHQ